MSSSKQTLNVLITARTLRVGGTEKALQGLLRVFDREGVTVTLLLEKLPNEDYNQRLPNNVKTEELSFDNLTSYALMPLSSPYQNRAKRYLLDNTRRFLTLFLGRLRVPFSKRYEYALRHVAQDNNVYDLALDFYGYGNFMTAYIANRIEAKRKATWIHSITLTGISRTAPFLGAYDKIYCVSQATLDEFVAQYPEHKKRGALLYSKIDIDDIENKARQSFDKRFQRDNFTIVTVGRLAPEKGLDISVKAAYYLKEMGYLYNWYVIGDGVEKDSIQKMIESYQLQNKFIILGAKENPYPYIALADLYVQTSRNEGFGLSVAEALMLNKTVVASDIPSFQEQIKHGVNGFLVKNEPRDIAKCVGQIIEGEFRIMSAGALIKQATSKDVYDTLLAM